MIDGPAVICSVLEPTEQTALRRIREAPAGCALVELRADDLPAEPIRAVVRSCARPLIVTVRRAAEGGRFRGSEEERRRRLSAALEAGARFVDVEFGSELAGLAADPQARSRVVLSHHGGPCRLQPLRSLLDRMVRCGAVRLKLVPRAGSVDELPVLRELLDRARRDGLRLAAFATGSAGALSRLLAPAWGSWATYGSAAPGRETAPGQFTARELLELYDVLRIGPRTRLFALVGSRVSRSPSPAMHAAGYRRAGLDARYLPLESERLKPVTELIRTDDLPLDALAVTMPFKERMSALCRFADPLVRACGALNTVVLDSQGWRAYNTDGPAALARIRRHLEPAGARVAVLGAGGTARAIAVVLRQAGADVVLFNRTAARGLDAAARTATRAEPIARLPQFEWDLLVHATPQGTRGERFVDPKLLRGRLVLDAVYAPVETALVRDARRRGLQAIDGHELLAAQAVLQFERMTGRSADYETLLAAAVQWQRGRVP